MTATGPTTVPMPSFPKQIELLAEKVGVSFGYQMLVMLVATMTTSSGAGLLHLQPWVDSFGTAGWTALLALGTGLVTVFTKLVTVLTGYKDVIVRVGLTFLQSFFGVLLASKVTDLYHVHWTGALGVAVPAALLSAFKSWGALHLPTTIHASLVAR